MTDTIPTADIEVDVAPADRGSLLGRLWRAQARFRKTRPFWGCLILGFGGWFVIRPAIGSFQMMTNLGSGGAAVYILGGGMIIAALIAFFVPAQRMFPALMAAVFSVLSLPMANLGGWLLGMVLGIIGSGMVFAWTPYTDEQLAKFAERAARKAEKKNLKKAAHA